MSAAHETLHAPGALHQGLFACQADLGHVHEFRLTGAQNISID